MNDNTNGLDYTILIKYIDGLADPVETATVSHWLQAAPENRILYFRIKDILDTQRGNSLPADTDQRWQQIAAQLEPRAHRQPVKQYRYAAAFIILLLAGGIMTFLLTRNRQQPMATLAEKKTAVQSILLPDSTRIWIKPGSTLQYRPAKDKDDIREVWLSGTGHFEVVKNASAPFKVHTASMTILVLGTAFTVNDNRQHSSVIVSTGMVQTTSGNHTVQLRHGERATLSGDSLRTDHVNAPLYAAWKDGNYKFEQTTLQEIKDLLQTSYGYDVDIRQPHRLRGTSVSGRALITDEAGLCSFLSGMLDANVSKAGNTIIIQPK